MPRSLVELTLDDVAGGTRIVVVEMPLVALDAVASVLIDGTAGHGSRMVAAGARWDERLARLGESLSDRSG